MKSAKVQSVDSVPFDIPSTWVWCHLDDIAPNVQYGYTASADASLQGIRLLRITDIQNNRVDWPSVPGCEIDEDTYKSYALQDDDVVIARTGGTIGKSFLVEGISVRAVFASYLIRVTPSKELYAKYIKRFLESPVYWAQLRAMSAGTGQPNVNGTALKSLLVPLPPLAEQRRIVAKVDQLLGLCDELAARQAAQREKRQRLVGATLDRLVSTRNPAEFPTHAHRLRNHFDQLFDTPTTIPQLRQTILQLAVQGQLVPQDPNDEPARAVLERAIGKQQSQSERKRPNTGGNPAKKNGTRRTDLDRVAVCLDHVHPVPGNWVWASWGEVVASEDGAFKRGPFGSSLRKADFVSSGYKVYEQYCPINDDCSFARYYITDDKFKLMESFAVRAGDFLVSCSGVTLGRITQVPQDFEPGIINQALLRVRINDHLLDSNYFKMLFRTPYFQRAIFDNSTGSAIPNVKGVKELKAIPIPVPPLAEQKRIVTKVTELLSLCDALEAKLTQAESASTQLLSAAVHHLLNGAVTNV
jgi:type I restriction enzyme S subunit